MYEENGKIPLVWKDMHFQLVVYERSEIDPSYLLEPLCILGGFFGQGDLYPL